MHYFTIIGHRMVKKAKKPKKVKPQLKSEMKETKMEPMKERNTADKTTRNSKTKKGRKKSPICFVVMALVVVVLNYVMAQAAQWLKIPFFLDTWGTMLGAMVAGLPVAMVGGFLYNLVMAFTSWGLDAWVWGFSSLWVAFITWYLWKKKWIDTGNPLKMVLVGVIIALTNAAITLAIKWVFFGGLPTYPGTADTYQLFYTISNGSAVVAAIGEHVLTELADKTMSVFVAAMMLDHLSAKLKKRGRC